MDAVPDRTEDLDRHLREVQEAEEEADRESDRITELETCIQQMAEYPSYLVLTAEQISDPASRVAFTKAAQHIQQRLKYIATGHRVECDI